MLNEEDEMFEDDDFVPDPIFKETAQDLTQKLKKDPYSPGSIHKFCLPEDASEMIEQLIYLEQYTQLTLRVKKGFDNYHLDIEIVERVK